MVAVIPTVFKEGSIVTLFGPPDAGKSNFASVMSEKAIILNFHVFSTIHYFKANRVEEAIKRGKLRLLPGGRPYHRVPDELHTVMSLGELFLGLLNPEIEHAPKLTIIDEAILYASSKSANSNKAKTVEQLATLIRHLGSSLLLLAQMKGGLTPALRSQLVSYEFNIEFRGGRRYFTIGFREPTRDEFTDELGVKFPVIHNGRDPPMTVYPMDSKYMPRFVFDMDLEEAFNRLGKYDSLEVLEKGPGEVKQLMKEWRQEHERKKRRASGEDPRTTKKVTAFVNKIAAEQGISVTNAFSVAAGQMGRSRAFIQTHYVPSKKENPNEEVTKAVNDVMEKQKVNRTPAMRTVAKGMGRSYSWVRDHYVP